MAAHPWTTHKPCYREDQQRRSGKEDKLMKYTLLRTSLLTDLGDRPSLAQVQ